MVLVSGGSPKRGFDWDVDWRLDPTTQLAYFYKPAGCQFAETAGCEIECGYLIGGLSVARFVVQGDDLSPPRTIGHSFRTRELPGARATGEFWHGASSLSLLDHWAIATASRFGASEAGTLTGSALSAGRNSR